MAHRRMYRFYQSLMFTNYPEASPAKPKNELSMKWCRDWYFNGTYTLQTASFTTFHCFHLCRIPVNIPASETL